MKYFPISRYIAKYNISNTFVPAPVNSLKALTPFIYSFTNCVLSTSCACQKPAGATISPCSLTTIILSPALLEMCLIPCLMFVMTLFKNGFSLKFGSPCLLFGKRVFCGSVIKNLISSRMSRQSLRRACQKYQVVTVIPKSADFAGVSGQSQSKYAFQEACPFLVVRGPLMVCSWTCQFDQSDSQGELRNAYYSARGTGRR